MKKKVKGILFVVATILVVCGVYKLIDAIQTASDLAYIRAREAREAEAARIAAIEEEARYAVRERHEPQKTETPHDDRDDGYASIPVWVEQEFFDHFETATTQQPTPPREDDGEKPKETAVIDERDGLLRLYNGFSRVQAESDAVVAGSNLTVGIELPTDFVIAEEGSKYSYVVVTYCGSVKEDEDFDITVRIVSDEMAYTGSIALHAEEALWLTPGHYYGGFSDDGTFANPTPGTWSYTDDYGNAKTLVEFPLYASPSADRLSHKAYESITGLGFHISTSYAAK